MNKMLIRQHKLNYCNPTGPEKLIKILFTD